MATSSDELTAYFKFIEKNYPNSICLEDLKKIPKILCKFFDSLKMLDLIVDYDDSDKIHNKINFTECTVDLKKSFLHLLLVLPLNDVFFTSAALRWIAESELKLVLVIISNNPDTLKNIHKIQFRHLWQDEIQQSQQYKNVEIKKYLDKISFSFRKNSDIIHNKETQPDNIIYLEKILSTNLSSFDISELTKELKTIDYFTLTLLPKFLQIVPSRMTMGQKGILKEMFSLPFNYQI